MLLLAIIAMSFMFVGAFLLVSTTARVLNRYVRAWRATHRVVTSIHMPTRAHHIGTHRRMA